MPSTIQLDPKECYECGAIIPFNNVVLERQKEYSVVFNAISSLPGCSAVVEPSAYSFVPTETLSSLYTSLRVFGCDDRSTTLIKMSVSDNTKEVYTDYTTVICGTCSRDAVAITPTPSTSIGVSPTPTPTRLPPTPEPTPTPSSLVAFGIDFPDHFIDVNCNSTNSLIFATLRGTLNRRYSYEFTALNHAEYVSFGNKSGEIFMSTNSMNISTNISVGVSDVEILVRCRAIDLTTQYVGDTLSVIKCINS